MPRTVMHITAVVCICTLAVASQSDASCKLPFAKRCKRYDPKLAECWKSVAMDAPQYLANGIPELNIPPIDPWRSPDYYEIKAATFYAGHSHMEHIGTKNFEIVHNSISLDLNIIRLKLRFPKLDHTCTTFANGTALGFQLLGVEGCNAAQADVTFNFVFMGKRKTIDGKEHIDFDNIDIIVDGTYTKQEYHNLVAGGAEQNKIFSAKAEQAVALFSPIYNSCLKSSIGLNIAQAIKSVYKECPLDTLHPL